VRPSSFTQATAGCQGGTTNSSGYWVQNADVINLNQPASCFALQLSGRQSFRLLTVQPLVPQNSKVVVVNAPVLSSGYAVPKPIQSIPTTPAIAVVLGAVVMVLLRKLARNTRLTAPALMNYNLTTAQLQVFRC
jgi:hypothetical protein